MDTSQFDMLLTEQSQDFQAAPEFGLDWFPAEEGEYVCQVSSVKCLVTKAKKGNHQFPLWRIGLELVEGEEAGEEMTVVHTGRDEMAMGRFKALLSTLQGTKYTGDLPTANSLVAKAVEDRLPVLVKYEKKPKGEGQTGHFDNVNVVKLLTEVAPAT